MRIGLLTLLLLQSCLIPVSDEHPDASVALGGDGGVVVDAGTPIDAGNLTIGCPDTSDAGGLFPWCNELPGNLHRCAEAELVGCSALTMQLVVVDGVLVWMSFDYPTKVSHIWARTLDGTPPRELASSPESYPLAVGAGFVWWGQVGANGIIRRVPLAGGATETFATGVRNPRSLVANASSVFWAADDGIWRAPTQGGTPTLFVANGAQPQGLVLDATSLYWGEANSGKIGRAALGGGQPSTLFSATTTPFQLGLADGYVYWSGDSATASITRGSITGGTPEILAANQDVPRDMAVDSQGLYWVEQGGNFGEPVRIHRAQPDGGSPTSFLTPFQGGRIALDARYLYFGTGNIY